ncbi:hypothetical protein [Nannocystis punicea]|uniref:Uncharacterized protein n=1 Tax=Nannocystis punicea TaxID=2995304 RepID=A0ABY7H967_9BACT|nr:hypothetical protein [Nannocystis poenicansa]WAS95688.1 hypothetical protein O0S08_05955 [Nannocystis poenicansa]
MTGTTTAPAGTTTVADPTHETTTVPGTSADPTTSPTATSDAPTTTTTGDDSSSTASTTTGSTSTSTTTDTTTTSTTTGDGSTAATTLEQECLLHSDCPNNGGECLLPACTDGKCTFKPFPAGTYCNGFQDQCDALGQCIDCVDNGGCEECCVCAGGTCIPG